MNFRQISGRIVQKSWLQHLHHKSTLSANYLNYGKDPAPLFFSPDIQSLMFSMTRIELEKVFRRRTVNDTNPTYKFLTNKQLENEIRKKFNEAKNLLQMPPILKLKEDNCKTISTDKALSKFSPHTFVFTDVSFGLKHDDRSIVTRDSDGTLKEASNELRKRMLQTYFPTENRSFREPKMFEIDNFKRLLAEHKYEFLLDRACCQYEPYEKRFHEITSQVYTHVNDNFQFQLLRSTRHFGPMSFFLAWHKNIDDLLLDMIRNDYLGNAVELICLMYKLNAINESMNILNELKLKHDFEAQIQSTVSAILSREQSIIKKVEKTSDDLKIDELCFEFIQDYVTKYSNKKPQLEITLQTYKEWHNELKSIQQGFQTN
ncbi:small ribosomal subunit protein mS22 [Chironomus tepperi]|uniref:small ribosomal subunit protein mS22 n=1 Tax=Chironomus tepperi TaxID=113505 RepID=UPI00391F1350